MKKSIYMACAAAVLLASCSQNELGSDTGVNENGDLIPIKIGVSQKNMSSRGVGTVGGLVDSEGNAVDESGNPIDPSANLWAGESFNLFMFMKDAKTDDGTLILKLSENNHRKENGEDILKGPIFDNEVFNAPKGHDGTDASNPSNYYAVSAAGNVRYYPAGGAHDFWAYRLDDCVNNTATGDYAISEDGKQAYVDFVMNGTQDIMTAKAEPSADQIAAVGGDNVNRFFSAWTARKGVIPNLKFQHELTRLKFFVKAGNEQAADPESGITVEGVKVLSKNTGRLIVAYTSDQEIIDRIIFGEDNPDTKEVENSDYLVLKERLAGANEPLTALTPQLVTIDYAPIGEALLVAPQDEYELVVTISQNLNFGGELTSQKTYTDIKTVIKPHGGNTISTFSKGNSYKVKVTLYGLQEIKVTTELTPWVDGEEVELIPEEDEF